MQIKWEPPHDLIKRLIQCLAVIGLLALLWRTAYRYERSVTTIQPIPANVAETVLSVVESESAETEKPAQTETEIPLTEIEPAAEQNLLLKPAEEQSFSLIDDIIKILYLQPNYLPNLSLKALTWEELEQELSDMTGDYSGNWSVYIKNLSTNEVISINDRPQESASLIKLFIMGAVMEQINNGTLEKTDGIINLLEEMITVSDNDAANDLVKLLSASNSHKEGLAIVNSFAARHGFTNTKQINGLNDSRLVNAPGKINQTSTRDCGELLSAIYDGQLVSHLSSRRMENWLLDQEVTYKIPTGLPDSAISANKTGETGDAENDSAIIYSPGGDFILCIMSEKWDNKNQAISHIREIAKLTYRYFNPEEN